MNPSTRTRAWLPALAACTALLGCQQRVIDPDREAGGSDEIDTRMAIDSKGRPLAGARIALVSVGDSTGKLAALSSTGSTGEFPSFNVPDGPYSATLRDAQDSLGKFLDTLQITGGKAKVGRDTLLALGKIRGVVRLVGGETPASVIMSLYGTDIAANVRKDGTFEIDLVPSGLFTLMGSTSLDGYGTLLRRLQLRDGQDLVIPDTLSLPVTGLLAPANIWLESDTGTGDVRVRWNQVDHPNRMGYVLEKVENGAVTRSQFLTDTVWKDSLKDHWEGLPLLGPWPSREAVYRVRTRSLNGAGDTRSVAQSFVAKAPEWTKRAGSFQASLQLNQIGTCTLAWTHLEHPRISGWHVERFLDGVGDCQDTLSRIEQAWSSVGCPNPNIATLDSNSPVTRLIRYRTPAQSFKISPLVTFGETSLSMLLVDSSRVFDQKQFVVKWRDSAVVPGGGTLERVGEWFVSRRPDHTIWLSRSLDSWEEFPGDSRVDWIFASEGLAIWGVERIWYQHATPGMLRIVKRAQDGVWSQTDAHFPENFHGPYGTFARHGRLWIGSHDGGLNYWMLEHEELVDSVSEIDPFLFDAYRSGQSPIDEASGGSRYELFYHMDGSGSADLRKMRGDVPEWERHLPADWYLSMIGAIPSLDAVVAYYGQEGPLFIAATGDAYEVPAPGSTMEWKGLNEILTVGDEIWVVDGTRLWKGSIEIH